ncbi:hypothetical protein ACGF5O_48685 [Streptomyces sp. NPDC048291]|uniref:hypothetical protein n=1 Tax=Streptomyces sp. NPDC048291 TaxID=3365530 RepID=UPI0037149267
MTVRPGHDPVDHWLVQQHHTLASALDELLDVKAGLREILIASRCGAAVDSLDTVLDIEGGLADILNTGPPPRPVVAHSSPGVQDLLLTVSPADRIALRNSLSVRTASLGLDRALAFTRDLDEYLGIGGAAGVDNTETLVRSHARRVALDLALALGRDISAVVNHVSHPGLDQAHALARELVRSLGLTRDPYFGQTEAEACARDIANVDSLCHALERERAHRLARALDRARALRSLLEHILGLLGRGKVGEFSDQDLTHHLDSARHMIVIIRIQEVCRAIGLALNCTPPALDLESLHTFLDDFTQADLRDADLKGTDLAGVHWSQHTTLWPPAVDINDLKTHSKETQAGSGVWIIRSGTATIQDVAEL